MVAGLVCCGELCCLGCGFGGLAGFGFYVRVCVDDFDLWLLVGCLLVLWRIA